MFVIPMARSLFSMVQPKYAFSSQEARALQAYETGVVRPEYTGSGAQAPAVELDLSVGPAPAPESSGPSKVLMVGGVLAVVAVGAYLVTRKKKGRR